MARAEKPPAPRSELVSLLTAARLSPWDDTPRQIVADWLEENGDASGQARAQFIRLQLKRAAKLKFGKRDRDYSRTEKHLLKDHTDAWLGGLNKLGPDEADVTFFRGLVDLRVSVDQLLQKASRPALESEAAAWLDEVALLGTTPAKLRCLLGIQVAGWIGGLLLGSQSLGEEACQVVRDAEALRGLHTLDMNYNDIGDEGARALAAANLGRMAHLDLWICGIGPDGARALAESRTMGQPEWLNLGGNRIEEQGARALAASGLISRARRLLLWGNQIGSEGVAALFKAPQLGPLEELYLNENRLGLPAARAIANWAGLPGLKTLSLWGNSIRARGAVLLGDAPLSSLRMLLLAGNGIGDEGAVALANNPHLGNLEQMDLGSNRISDEGARAILGSPHLLRLTNLNLSGNRVSTAVVEALSGRFDPTVNDEVP